MRLRRVPMSRIENTFRVGNDCGERCRISIVEKMVIVGVEKMQRISTAAEYANGILANGIPSNDIPANGIPANRDCAVIVGIDVCVALDGSSWEIFSICWNSF